MKEVEKERKLHRSINNNILHVASSKSFTTLTHCNVVKQVISLLLTRSKGEGKRSVSHAVPTLQLSRFYGFRWSLLLPVQRGHITCRRIHTHYMQIGQTIYVYMPMLRIRQPIYDISSKMLYVCGCRGWKMRSNSGKPSISLFLPSPPPPGYASPLSELRRLHFFVFHVVEHDMEK